jgi:hypothetical protein
VGSSVGSPPIKLLLNCSVSESDEASLGARYLGLKINRRGGVLVVGYLASRERRDVQ